MSRVYNFQQGQQFYRKSIKINSRKMLDTKGTSMSVMKWVIAQRLSRESLHPWELTWEKRETWIFLTTIRVPVSAREPPSSLPWYRWTLWKMVADYIVTGQWAKKRQWSAKYGKVNKIASSQEKKTRRSHIYQIALTFRFQDADYVYVFGQKTIQFTPNLRTSEYKRP